jgi:hypothetical protein
LVGTRVYPDFVPEERALPAIAVARANTEYISTIHSVTPLGSIVTLDVWCMAESRAAAEDLGTKAAAALTTFTLQNRTPEFDSESGVYATVLTTTVLET